MAKKKAEQVGQGIGLIVGLAVVVALLAAAVLPLFLLFRYLQHRYLSYKLRRDYNMAENGWQLSAAERKEFKESYAAEKSRIATNLREHATLVNLIALEHKRAMDAGLPTTNLGRISRHSNLGKEIQDKIDELEGYRQELDLNQYEISCRQPIEFWNELNDLLKKQDVAFLAFLGWACGAFFFYSAYQQGAPFGIWTDVFAAALCAGVGAALAALFIRKPAVRYMPKPREITIENVDSTEVELPKKSRLVLKLAGICVWIAIMAVARDKGRQYGTDQAIARREQIKLQQTLASENERQLQGAWNSKQSAIESATKEPAKALRVGILPTVYNASEIEKFRNTVCQMPLSPVIVTKLNAEEVEDLILIIYARYGAVFESLSAQRWADQQPWYKKVPGKSIKQAEKEFSYSAVHNVAQLVERWNRIQVEDGLAPVPVDEGPLAGRAVSPDLEKDTTSLSSAVLKALPVEETSSVVLGDLSLERIQGLDLATVRYEINRIYARHGVVFPKQEIQDQFEKQAWYKPDRELTFDQAEEKFSMEERHNIEALAARRDMLMGGNQAQMGLPVSTPLTAELVATWDAARVRNELNTIYARYGVDFTNAELRKWAEKQPGYKSIPGRTFADAEALFSEIDRGNIEMLASRRSQINSSNQ